MIGPDGYGDAVITRHDDGRLEEGLCCVCAQLRPNHQPRRYDTPNACNGCRRHLATMLDEIPDRYAKLPANLIRSSSGWNARVTGGEVTAALPFVEDVHDLLGAVDERTAHDQAEQVGYRSVATILYGWVRDFCGIRDRGETGVATTDPSPLIVGIMARWLRERVDWACDQHPAVDEFAADMRRLHHALGRFTGSKEPKPEPCLGVPCKRCDFKALVKLADGSGDVECQNPDCRMVYRADEYERWVRLVAAAVKESA